MQMMEFGSILMNRATFLGDGSETNEYVSIGLLMSESFQKWCFNGFVCCKLPGSILSNPCFC